jgi:HlyD family secretion protein
MVIALRRPAPTTSHRYRTETVARGPVTGLLPLSARLQATAEVRVGPEHAGRVAVVAVHPGDHVRRGDVLARLDARQLRADAVGADAGALAAQVGARHAQLQMAQIVYLLRQNLGHPSTDETRGPELEGAALDAEANLANAAAQLHKQAAVRVATRANLAAAVLRAPIDGVVVSRAVEPDETVQAGAPLFVVASDPAEVQLVAAVGELDAGRLRPGPATFEVPAHPGRTFEALAGPIEPTPASSGAPYRMRLFARNPGRLLAPGMTATVKLPASSSAQSLKVPMAALAFSPDGPAAEAGTAVYVLGPGSHPRRIAVDVGVTDGRTAEIRSPALPSGTAVIVGQR